MTFIPSEYSYGWASAYPLSTLTVSSTATARGLSNQPVTSAHERNLSLLSDFLGKLAKSVSFRVNSGYRSSEVNAAIGGSSTSQHMNGLGADITPYSINNEELAAWLYGHRADFPELDQVIWYKDTHHVHIGICPSGATGCPRSSGPRGEFYWAQKESSTYVPWAPTAAATAAMLARVAYHRPLLTYGLALGAWILTGGVVVVGLGLMLALKRGKARKQALRLAA
jgi:hypothetical protein